LGSSHSNSRSGAKRLEVIALCLAYAIFTPCDDDRAIEAFESLPTQVKNREKFIEKYLRKNIVENLSEDIVSRFGRKS
jgi:hypothetical protein